MNAAATSAALLSVAVAAAGCVTGRFSQVTFNEPVPSELLQALRPGVDTLQTCLDALGAPVRVFEYQVAADRSSGVALLWSWRQNRGWGIDVSANIDDASVSFDYASESTGLPGCVLWFGPDLVLERWREGLVGDLLPERARPAPVLD